MLADYGEKTLLWPFLYHVFPTAQLQTKTRSAKRVDFGTTCLYGNMALVAIS